MQVMPFEDAAGLSVQPVRRHQGLAARRLPADHDRPAALNRNPENYFAEVEQAAFEPANMVPGIGPSPDKMLQARLFSYPDAHRHRIGTNYQQLPINQPLVDVHSYNKDGAMRYRHSAAQPVYAPNSYGGPTADARLAEPTWHVDAGEVGRYAYKPHAEDDDFGQPPLSGAR